MLETPYMKLWKRDEILFCTYSDKLEIDLEIAVHCVKTRIEFSEGKSYPVLIRLQGIRSVNKEARDYFSDEGSKLITAGALLISSPLTKILGNIFMHINKPDVPTKLFTNETEAKEWLKKFIKYDDRSNRERQALRAAG